MRRPVEAGAEDRPAAGLARKGKRVCRADRRVGNQCALDVQSVVAFTEQQVDHFDGALLAVGLELPIHEGDRAEADAAGEDRRLAEERISKDQVLGHLEALQRGRGHHAAEVLLAGVVEDVEHIDGLAFRRLRADGDERRVCLARQLDTILERAIRPGDAPFDRQRTTQLRHQMLRHREELHALTHQRHVVERIGVQLELLLHIPSGVGEQHDRRRAGDLNVVRAEQEARIHHDAGEVLVRDFERVILGGIGPADDGDLVIAGIHAASGDAEALAFQERVRQPAGAVGARQPIERQ